MKGKRTQIVAAVSALVEGIFVAVDQLYPGVLTPDLKNAIRTAEGILASFFLGAKVERKVVK